MILKYDKDVDAAYIALKDIEEGEASLSVNSVQPEECPGEINLDFDSNGKLLGIEIINASLVLPENNLNIV